MEQEVIEATILRLIGNHGSYPAASLTRDVQRELAPSKKEIRAVIIKLMQSDQIIEPDWHGNFVMRNGS